MDMNIVNKIKKLLQLGQANSGATDAEASTAMEMAAAMMLKHGIEVQLDDEEEKGVEQGDMMGGYNESWHYECAAAAAMLYSCRNLIWRRIGKVAFVGRADNIDACEATMVYLCSEVERLYKLNLPKGMSKLDRANFRSTFKFSCARRLAARAWAIMETLRNDDAKAIAATGSKALVVVQSIDAQLAEADAMLGAMGVKTAIVKSHKFGLGTAAGKKAGDTVQLQKQVK